MNAKNFYGWSLVMPIAVPLLCSTVFLFPDDNWVAPFKPVASFLLYSVALGGIPYLLTLALTKCLEALRDGDEQLIKRWIWFLPLWMLPVQFITCCVAGLVYGLCNAKEFLSIVSMGILLGLVTLPFVLGFGYVYVILTHLLWGLAKYAGLAQGESDEFLYEGGYR